MMKLFPNSTIGLCDPDYDLEFELKKVGNFAETLQVKFS